VYWRFAQQLVESGPLRWWLVAFLLLGMVIWVVARYADKLANAVDRVMLAFDRRAARKAALAASTTEQYERARTVLDSLKPPPPLPQGPPPAQKPNRKRRALPKDSFG
jgi:hypothetical protein